MSQSRTYPLSDHCDGRQFFNSTGVQPMGLKAVLRWKFTSRPAAWPKQVQITRRRLADSAPRPGGIAATWINHSSFLLRTPLGNLLIDPVYSEKCGPFGILGPRRVHEVGIPFDDLPPIHGILVSHDHYDHCDLSTLRRLAKRDRPWALTPLGNRDLLHRAGLTAITELDWWEEAQPLSGLKITVTPSQHWSNRLSGKRCARLWGGFAIEVTDRLIFFTGDTGYDPQLHKEIGRRCGSPDLALLPIGAYEPRWFMQGQHCNPAEAVKIHRDLGSRQSIAMHWGTFQLTDEARDAPPIALREALHRATIPESEFLALEPGASFEI